jgi:hypothetical protein
MHLDALEDDYAKDFVVREKEGTSEDTDAMMVIVNIRNRRKDGDKNYKDDINDVVNFNCRYVKASCECESSCESSTAFS